VSRDERLRVAVLKPSSLNRDGVVQAPRDGGAGAEVSRDVALALVEA